MTLLGPCSCRSCGATVTVVRRPVVIRGHYAGCGNRSHPPCVTAESRELVETVTVDTDGRRHRCAMVAAA